MTADAFLRAIVANPDSDSLRLRYADWLEDEGDADRSEFIRVQCARADLEYNLDRGYGGRGVAGRGVNTINKLRRREHDLLANFAGGWCDGIPAGVELARVTFRRGFVEAVSLDWAVWCRNGDEVTARQPVTRVALEDWPAGIALPDQTPEPPEVTADPACGFLRTTAGRLYATHVATRAAVTALLRARWETVREWVLPEPRATLTIDGERIDFRSVRLAEGAAGDACECRGDLPPADLAVEMVYEPEALERIINGHPRATHPLGIPNLAMPSGGPHPRRPPPRLPPSNSFRRR